MSAHAAAAISAANAVYLAACPHYGVCGGCEPCPDKAELLRAALEGAGFIVPTPPLVVSAPASRRRMDLAVRRSGPGTVTLGLHPRRSHAVVDLTECRVLRPELAALLPELRAVLGKCDLLRRQGAVIGNLTETGPDLLVRSDGVASRHDRTRLAAFAESALIARIAHDCGTGSETLVERVAPRLRFGAGAVLPPAGAFLQATAAGEAAIRAAVLAGLAPAMTLRARIAELHAGCGTLSFALAERGVVDAFEGDQQAAASLERAARQAGLDGRLRVAMRDLARQPLVGDALAPYAALVLDPPESGAREQIHQIAQAARKPKRVIYVSCGLDSLRREASMLRGAGYALLTVTGIDQFIGTARVESVSVFERAGRYT